MLSNARALSRYGVTANCISPAASTRMTDRGLSAQSEQREGSEAPSLAAEGTAMDPKNVVPAIVYLASDEGANVTGRVFGATGHRISVWQEPEWESAIYSETPFFDIDKLFEVVPQTLGARGWDLPPMQI
jgi:hypothetical protein